jgi:hypothetical protein
MSVQPESKTLETPFASEPLLSPAEPWVDSPGEEAEVDYRSLHTPALVSVVLGVASIMAMLMSTTSVDATLVMCTIPFVGLFVGIRAWLTIKREPEIWTGLRFAIVGTFLSAFFLLGSPLTAMYVYATEVPAGYERITFTEMKPDDKEVAKGIPIPPEIMALDGQRIFIKGYMRPSSQSFGLDNFLLVRDNNQCCFGQLSEVKYFDQIQIHLQGDRKADYSRGVFRMGGILKIDPTALFPGSAKPVFTLLADYSH